jgi:excinuclease ABC subunit B
MAEFNLQAPFRPFGDQPQAIAKLTEGLRRGESKQTLLGVTGSGKTFTVANLIQELGRPTLIISHNKTLAAQLYGEFKSFFPDNGVGFFISYYDYYQPEAYLPSTDTFIEKDASINDEIDRLRLRATALLLERRDVIIIASVSCIYGLGAPEDFRAQTLILETGQEISREQILERLIQIQYSRNDLVPKRGVFRARGDLIEVYPAHSEDLVRISLFGDEIESISRHDPLTRERLSSQERIAIFPASHFVMPQERVKEATSRIGDELDGRLTVLRDEGRLLEAQRIGQRTRYDLEMMREMGYCQGIENYSRHLSGRKPGERPACLIDYFPDDFLLVIDESHVTLPQVRAMYAGDQSRKKTLVEYGFRLPSALDNRPLTFDEFDMLTHDTIYVSATPADYELDQTEGVVVEQVIRPTGLLDPEILLQSVEGQMEDLLERIRGRTKMNERVLVTTLTKRMSEQLTDYLLGMGVKVRYIHSDVPTIERTEILRDLRLGNFNVLVGINLLREGLDLPEVSLVAILDADKEGFLRSARALIQTAGRAARNVNGQVVLYADRVTNSMQLTIDETERRRTKQLAYNKEHGITPRTISKSTDEIMGATIVADGDDQEQKGGAPMAATDVVKLISQTAKDPEKMIIELQKEMREAAQRLEFEKAASLRDRIFEIRANLEMRKESE